MLSVIFPTRNRATLLDRALHSLLIQTLSPEHFEVIVVDNGSTDNTFDVVRNYHAKLQNLSYFKELEPGLHVGRHKGCIEAKSDLLVFADDDIEAFPTWLQAIKDSFENDEVAMVGGKCLPKFEHSPPKWLCSLWSPNGKGERILGHLSLIDLGDQTTSIDPMHVFGCNLAIRRSVLLDAGGFHPDAMPQELIQYRGDGETSVSKYVQANKYKAIYNPSASIFHWVPDDRMTFEYFYRRMYNQGVSDSYTAIRQAKCIDLEPFTINCLQRSYQRLRNNVIARVLWISSRIAKRLYLDDSGRWYPACEQTLLRRHLAVAYQAGFAFHQGQVRESPELLAWVLRPDYWGAGININQS